MRNWDDLRYFLAVARHKTLAGAARELGVTHSTVFRRITLLEDRLGSRLFDRLATGYRLTAIGGDMLAIAEELEQSVNLLVRKVSGADLRLSGALRITTTDTLAHSLLNPHLKLFQDTYPDIEIQVNVQNRFLSLTNREADVAIRPSIRLDEGEVIGRHLSDIAAALYASRGYLEINGRPCSMAELKKHKVISGDESLENTVTVRFIRQYVRRANVVYRSNSLVDQLHAAQGGFGIAAIPCFMADTDPQLVRLFPPEKRMANKLWLLVHRDLRRNARVRAFSDFMYQSIVTDRDLLEGRRPPLSLLN
jgi:DNA-binding transcriptional LysR family regulator